MTEERFSHCDGVRITLPIATDLKQADRILRIETENGEVISSNRWGFSITVGSAEVFCRPWGPRDSAMSTHLTLDYNPGKLGGFFGLFDDRHPFVALTESCQKPLKALAIPYDPAVKEAILRGEGTISRMHLTTHFFAADVPAVLEQIKQEIKDRGIKFSSEGYGATVYVNKVDGKESRHWVLVIYDKYRELRKNRPKGITDAEYTRILELAKGVVRVELRLNSKFLPRRKLRHVWGWKDFDVDALVFRYLDRLGLRSVAAPVLTKEEQVTLSPTEQRDLALWFKGGDLKPPAMSPRTFQKRVALFKQFGIDIRGRYRPPHEERVDLSGVFARENLVPPSHWIKGSAVESDL